MKLKDKAISIKGNAYVLVSDRVLHFNENYPNGSISTELVSDATADMVVVKATVLPDCDAPQRMFTGYSQATWGDGMVNKTAALENCETSAVGRALGFMGIGVIDSVASADEMNKAMTQPARKTVDKRVEKYSENMCEYHKVEMFKRGQMKEFGHKHDVHGWCNGKGYKHEIQAHQDKLAAERVADDAAKVL